MEVVSFTSRPLYSLRKRPRYPLNRRLDGPQRESGSCGEEKILASDDNHNRCCISWAVLAPIIIIIIVQPSEGRWKRSKGRGSAEPGRACDTECASLDSSYREQCELCLKLLHEFQGNTDTGCAHSVTTCSASRVPAWSLSFSLCLNVTFLISSLYSYVLVALSYRILQSQNYIDWRSVVSSWTQLDACFC
jgi:hypothetical protein